MKRAIISQNRQLDQVFLDKEYSQTISHQT
ncbi:hypothetical protein M2263_002552 [Providencia alcalifaciens]|nr:hypothetical protein [Providencia alcalifaciens]